MVGGVVSFLGYILQGIRSTASTLGNLPFRFQFVGLWLIGLLFLLFNASAFYGEDAPAQTTVLSIYMVSLAFVFSQTGKTNPLVGISTAEFVITFSIWVAFGAALFKVIQPFNPEVATLTAASVGILVTHALVVAIGEELLFRFAIPSMIPGPAAAAQTISAVLFGVMHWSAYGGSWENMLFATILGLVFGAITARFRHGLIIAMALHFTWNSYTLGYI